MTHPTNQLRLEMENSATKDGWVHVDTAISNAQSHATTQSDKAVRAFAEETIRSIYGTYPTDLFGELTSEQYAAAHKKLGDDSTVSRIDAEGARRGTAIAVSDTLGRRLDLRYREIVDLREKLVDRALAELKKGKP